MKKPLCLSLLLFLLGAWLGPAPAWADNLEAAKESFQKGRQAYYEGRYEEAIGHYQSAMTLKYSPKLNYNIGLAFAKIGQPEKALSAFRRYLQEEPNATNVEEVRKRLETLEQQIQEANQPGVDSPGSPGALPPPRTPTIQPTPLSSPAVGGSIRRVTIDFFSEPSQAELFIGGQSMGITPMRLNLNMGATYALSLEKRGFQTITRQYQVKGRERVNLTLHYTPLGRTKDMTRTEWFGLETALGRAPLADSASFGLNLQIVTLKWRRVTWTIGELSFLAGGMFTASFGTRPGFPIYLGDRGQHQLRASLGLHFGGMSYDKDVETNESYSAGGNGLVLSPAIEYHYQFAGSFFIGVGFKALWYAAGSSNHPALLLFTVPLGWSSRH